MTLLGAAGCGKTRLAVAVGERLKQRYEGRVSFIDLLRGEPGHPSVGAFARQLELPLVPRVDDTETLKRALDGDAMLLIVDNCEHVAGEAAAAAGTRRECRARQAQGIARCPLFVDRAQRVSSSFELTASTSPDIVRICCAATLANATVPSAHMRTTSPTRLGDSRRSSCRAAVLVARRDVRG